VVDLAGAIHEAGESHDLAACGLGARDTLRLEVGLPLYGHELSRNRPAHASGMGWVIDLNAEFVGRDHLASAPAEILVAVDSRGKSLPARIEKKPLYKRGHAA
jgi:aminomethyltransferase